MAKRKENLSSEAGEGGGASTRNSFPTRSASKSRSSSRAGTGPGRLVLSVDVGTSSIKGGLVDEEGLLLAWDRLDFGPPSTGEYERWDAGRWLYSFELLVRRLLSKSAEGADNRDGYLERLSAIAVSGNGPSLVPVDEQGEPLSEALLWIDGRARPRGGSNSFFLPKAAWLAEERPRVYRQSKRLLGCPEFIAYHLTGKAAAFTPSKEFIPYIWDAQELSVYGFSRDADKFPPPLLTGTLLGRVSEKASKRFSLPEGLPVVAGGPDFLMALLGTAVVKPGRTCDRTGTSEGINCCSELRVEHPRIRTLPHAVEGYYNAAGILSSTGMIFEWFRRLTGQRRRSYADMLEEIRRVKKRPNLPFFFPSVHRGAVWEFSGGAFTGLEADHGAAEMGRAVVHSVGFGIRDLVETLEKEGCTIESLRVSGGQGRNAVWNQMKADMTGKRVEIPRIIDAELAGGAVAAFAALDNADRVETAERIVQIEEVFEPEPSREREYTEEYERYERLCAEMLPALSEETAHHRIGES